MEGMQSVTETVFKDDILEVFSFDFGHFYLFDHFIVSEIFEGVVFSSKHGKVAFNAINAYYDQEGLSGKKVYISNRINNYSVKPLGWLKFSFLNEKLHGYAVVSLTSGGIANALLESKFVPVPFKSFTSLFEAIQWTALVNDAQKFDVDNSKNL